MPLFGGNSDMKKEDGNHIEALPFHHNQTKGGTNIIWTFMLFVEVLIYGSFSVLVNLSKINGKLPFNTSTLVLLIETTKFVLSAVMYFPEFMSQNFRVPHLSLRICVSYSIPAVLYALNNNLGLHMQTQMDPTTHQVLSNLKIATTGLLYRIIIKRKLTNYQWLALGLLMLAGVSHSYGGFHSDVPNAERIFVTAAGLMMMMTYTIISGLAAVYTEYIMKSQFKVSLHVQNMLLYSYGMLLNLSSSWWSTEVSHDGSHDKSHVFLTGFTIYTWLIILTQAFNGLIMSVVMKHGSNITRLFIVSGGMLTSTLLSMCLLGTAISVAFVVAAALVILAIYLYHL